MSGRENLPSSRSSQKPFCWVYCDCQQRSRGDGRQTYVGEFQIGVVIADLKVAAKELTKTAEVDVLLGRGLGGHKACEQAE